MNRFARLLHEAVKKNNITYRKAAGIAGVSPDMLSRIVLGNRLPSPKNAVKLAKALGIDEQEALMAVNYDKVPLPTKKYFTLPKPKYPLLRQLLINTYSGEKGSGRKVMEEISRFQCGSLEMLLITRMLIASQSFYETLVQQKKEIQTSRENLKRIETLLRRPSLEIGDEEAILKILARLTKWQSLGPDYSLQIWFAHPDGGCPSFVTGETRLEKPLFSFTNSEPVEVPLLEDKIAAGVPLPISGNWAETRFFTHSFLKKFTDPVLIEVGKDQDSMIPIIFPGDLLLLDRKPVEKPKHGHIYAVNLEDGGSVKYCEIRDSRLYISCENKFSGFKTVILEIENQLLTCIIVGEVVWVGRELRSR